MDEQLKPEPTPICSECGQSDCPVMWAITEAAKGNTSFLIARYLKDGHNYG